MTNISLLSLEKCDVHPEVRVKLQVLMAQDAQEAIDYEDAFPEVRIKVNAYYAYNVRQLIAKVDFGQEKRVISWFPFVYAILTPK